jgi:chromatin assembly factor 1 subunit B
MSNPPLIGGSVPGIAATNSGKVTGVPITTPPETPRSATGSVTGTKRDASQASESEKEESSQPKKRRIAPTPVEKA